LTNISQHISNSNKLYIYIYIQNTIRRREKLAGLAQMNNVAALQNQLALDVAQRMQSIEDLLDGKNAAPTKPDPEVEAWKAKIKRLSEAGPPPSSSRSSSINNPAASNIKKVTAREQVDFNRQKALKTSYELAQEGSTINQTMKNLSLRQQQNSPRAPSTAHKQPAGMHQPSTSNPHLHRGAVPVGHSGWFRAFDPKTGRPYLFNPETKETKWEKSRSKKSHDSSKKSTHHSKSGRAPPSEGTTQGVDPEVEFWKEKIRKLSEGGK
jgi:hypothetical protein